MKKTFYALTLLLLCATQALADKITEQQALEVASNFFGKNVKMRAATNAREAVLQLAHADEGYFAFNRGTTSGFVIVAADDMVPDAVLGFADNGTFSADSMPDNLRWWLGEYARELAYATTHGGGAAVLSEPTPRRADIEPLVTAQWNQGAPYNNLCPKANGTPCPTGCVATAVAQIMYYHKWPLRGTGSHAYEQFVNGESQGTVSADFSQSTYSWGIMTDTYGAESSSASANAVAQLMRDIGVAVEMEYAPSGSGAVTTESGRALVSYFGYDKSVTPHHREFYGRTEWEDMVYASLAKGDPVLYSGRTAGNSGHAFVCDGYFDGYFHINWGWGGMSDGYFKLNALDPAQQGIGGSTAGFDYNQTITVNIKKDEGGSIGTPIINSYGGFDMTDKELNTSSQATFTGNFYNDGLFDCTITAGIKVVSTDGSTSVFLPSTLGGTLGPNWGFSEYTVNLASFPEAEGTYFVYPAFRDDTDGSWHDIRTPITYYRSRLVATVDGDNITFSYPSTDFSKLTTTAPEALTQPAAYQTFKAQITISNTGSEYYGSVRMVVANEEVNTVISSSNYIRLDLLDGEQIDLTFTLDAPDAGNYQLVLINDYNQIVSQATPITVDEAPEDYLNLQLKSAPVVENADNVVADNFKVTATVVCNSGHYTGTFYAYYFSATDGSSISYLRSDVDISKGDEKTVSFAGELKNVEKGGQYLVAIYYLDGYYLYPINDPKGQSYSSFTVGALTGVDGVDADEAEGDIAIYNLSGVCVARQRGSKADLSTLVPGIYIVKTAGGETRRVIKR